MSPIHSPASAILLAISLLVPLTSLAATTEEGIAEFKKDPGAFIIANPSIAQEAVKDAILSDPTLLTALVALASDPSGSLAQLVSSGLADAVEEAAASGDPALQALAASISTAMVASSGAAPPPAEEPLLDEDLQSSNSLTDNASGSTETSDGETSIFTVTPDTSFSTNLDSNISGSISTGISGNMTPVPSKSTQ